MCIYASSRWSSSVWEGSPSKRGENLKLNLRCLPATLNYGKVFGSKSVRSNPELESRSQSYLMFKYFLGTPTTIPVLSCIVLKISLGQHRYLREGRRAELATVDHSKYPTEAYTLASKHQYRLTVTTKRGKEQSTNGRIPNVFRHRKRVTVKRAA